MQEDREQGQSPLAPIDIEAPISQQVQNDSQATDEVILYFKLNHSSTVFFS